jgi:zinc protease
MTVRILMMMVLGMISLGLQAQSIQAPRLHVLDNGMRVITVEDPASEIVTTTWSAHVGDSAEPADFAGNSHYLEHLLLFRGTEKFPRNGIGEWVASRGGYFNGHTWFDYTTFEIMSSPLDMDAALERHEEMMFHANFSGEDFETEKKAVFEELRSGLDSPFRYLFDSSAYDMYPEETFYSRSTIGSIDKVQAATVERVREYYKRYYVPNNITLAVVGNIDTDTTLQAIENRFAGYGRSEVPPSIYGAVSMKPGITLVTEEREIGTAYFLLAFEGPRAESPEYFPYRVLSEYLAGGKASLLNSQLVTEKKLVDDIFMSNWPRRYPKGWQAIAAQTKPENLAKAVNTIWLLLDQTRQSGIPEQELELAKKRLLKAHRALLDDQYQYASGLVEHDAHGDYRLFSEFEARLAEVSLNDVQAVARKLLTPQHFFLKSIFPPGTIPENFEEDVRANSAGMPGGQSTVQSDVLDSGVTLIHEKRQSAAIESFVIGIRAGDRYGQQAGLADAVARMMSRETAEHDRTALQNYLDLQSFTLSSWTDSDGAYFNLELPPGSIEEAMALLVEVLTTPAFSDSEWDSIRDEMVSELNSSQDQPSSVARDLMMETVFQGTPYGRASAQSLDSLPSLTSRQLKNFWSEYYRTGDMVISYVGASAPEVITQGFEGLGVLKRKVRKQKRIDVQPLAESVYRSKPMEGKTQANIYMVWPAPDLLSEQWVLWELAQQAIGGDLAGRLWKLRQDEGLAYSVWLSGSAQVEQPLTYVYMATAGEKREQALAAINREIVLAQQGLASEELERVRVAYFAAMNRTDRTSGRRAYRQALWWMQGHQAQRREDLQRIISGATLESVNQVVAEVLDPEIYVLVEAGMVPEAD